MLNINSEVPVGIQDLTVILAIENTVRMIEDDPQVLVYTAVKGFFLH